MSRSPVLPFARWGIRLLLLPLVIVGATAHLGRTQGTTLTSGYLWQFLGPSAINGVVPSFGTFNVGSSLQNVTGRVTAVAIDPRTPAQIFVGTKGGVWISTSSGNQFSPFADVLPQSVLTGPTQSIGAIALDSVNSSPTTVYVATGEANQSFDSTYGLGIYKSTDLGRTITWLLYPGQYVIVNGNSVPFGRPTFGKLAIDTSHNPPYFYAAGSAFGQSTNRTGDSTGQSHKSDGGLYISKNGGAAGSWAARDWGSRSLNISCSFIAVHCESKAVCAKAPACRFGCRAPSNFLLMRPAEATRKNDRVEAWRRRTAPAHDSGLISLAGSKRL